MESKRNIILEFLKTKASTKQQVFRLSKEIFSRLKSIAAELVDDLHSEMKELDNNVEVAFFDKGDFEFQIKFSGELVVYSMHSNIVTFTDKHVISKNEYVQSDQKRQFFAAIMVYNFLNDSLKYSRLGDTGYLLARLFFNLEEHFYIEGVRQLNFLYPDISKNVVTPEILRSFVESTMVAALENDTVMPNFDKLRQITVHQKLSNQMLGQVKKVGFRMSTKTK